MDSVGDHLLAEAERRARLDDKTHDQFARSAINRFYCAAFLEAREAYLAVQGSQTPIKHSELPKNLRSHIEKTLKDRLRRLNPKKDSNGIVDSRVLRELLGRSPMNLLPSSRLAIARG